MESAHARVLTQNRCPFRNLDSVRENKLMFVSFSLEPGKLSRYSDGLWAGEPGFDFLQGQETFLHSTASIPDLETTKTPIKWVPGVFLLG
jgi:hypothetical protein